MVLPSKSLERGESARSQKGHSTDLASGHARGLAGVPQPGGWRVVMRSPGNPELCHRQLGLELSCCLAAARPLRQGLRVRCSSCPRQLAPACFAAEGVVLRVASLRKLRLCLECVF